MKIALRLVLLAVLGVVGWWLWTVLHPSPEKIIRSRLTELAQAATFTGKEGLVNKGLKITKIGTFFADQVDVSINIPKSEMHTINSRNDITLAAEGALGAYGSVTVELLDPNIVLSPDKESAVVDATVRVKLPSEQDIIQELKFTLRKIKNEWLIIKIETVRTLSQRSAALWAAACLNGTVAIPQWIHRCVLAFPYPQTKCKRLSAHV